MLPFFWFFYFLDTDPNYRKYAANIDRALGLWDNVAEWADYISFLGKLHKALKSHSFSTIPHSSLIATRLGQCIQPDLPSGVHQKALEVYNTAFSLLGENLDKEIDLWIPGLIPLMPYASINVKPILINLLNKHVLVLKSLRKIVIPLLYSLLPGIDDESSESFDAVLKLLDDIKLRVNDDSHFWQCYFMVIINSSDRRLGALVWANRRLPKFNSILSANSDPISDKTSAFQALSYEAQTAIIPEPGLFIRAFCKGLEDDQILVQRGFLELLVKNIELQSPALQFVTTQGDLNLLVTSACTTVLRRDMSLNRRLWNWLLGPDPTTSDISGTPNREEYFKKYVKPSVVNGLLEMISSSTKNVAERCKPYRISLSIMDRWEIGGNVISELLIPIIKSVKSCETTYEESQYAEILRSASAFFDGVETITIWSECLKLVQSATEENLSLLIFIMQSFNVEEEEMIVQQLPLILIAAIITKVPKSTESVKLQLVQLLLDLIPDRAFLPLHLHTDTDKLDEKFQDDEYVMGQISEYYGKMPDQSEEFPFSSSVVTQIIHSRLTDILIALIKEKDFAMTGKFSVFLSQFLQKIHHKEGKWRDDKLIEALQSLTSNDTYDFTFVFDITNFFITIMDGFTDREIDFFLKSAVNMIWKSLITKSGTKEVEAVKALWKLQEALQDRRLEACIASLFVDRRYSAEERGRALAALWNHSSERSNADIILNRSIFLILEDLRYSSSLQHLVATHWIEQVVSSGSVNRLLSLITSPILNTPLIQRESKKFSESDDLEVFSYYCDILCLVIKSHPHLCRVFTKEFIPMDLSSVSLLQSDLNGQDSTYSILLKRAIFRLFSFEVPDSNTEPELFSSYESVLSISLDLLSILVDTKFADLIEAIEILMQLLKRFNHRNDDKNLSEIRIIDLLSKLLKKLNSLGPLNQSSSGLNSLDTLSQDVESQPKDPRSQLLEKLIKDLVDCLIDGFASNNDLYVVESWVSLLSDCIPLFGDMLLQVLLSLVECLTSRISSEFEDTKRSYSFSSDLVQSDNTQSASLSVMFAYITALGKLLSTAHHKLSPNDQKATQGKTTAEPGFFGSVMSGVFAIESPLARSTAANNRLTVLLSFQDTIQECFKIWTWVEENDKQRQKQTGNKKGDSQMYHSARLKFWTRKIMESLYRMEALETLEIFIEIGKSSPYIFKVLHSLDGSKPKTTIPHLFRSVVSRVNPLNVESQEQSTLTSDLSDSDLMSFLVEYLKSLENDAVEDIWTESIGFLREVQNNSSLYRHLMPDIFRFISVLATKVDTLTFGEQRRVRRDLNDIFVRLFNPVLSTKSIITATTSDNATFDEKAELGTDTLLEKGEDSSSQATSTKSGKLIQEKLTSALIEIVPTLQTILTDNDKVIAALSTIVTNFISPAAKLKTFPKSFPLSMVTLLNTVISQPGTQKAWRTTVGDIIFDQRFLNMSFAQAEKWKPIVDTWAHADKERLKDYMSGLLSHGSNSNVLFGWTDQESTYTHRNLKRLAFIFLSGRGDGYLMNMKTLTQKLNEVILTETSVDSLRNEVFTCIRAIILKVDPTHLTAIWTFVYTELYKTFESVFSIYSGGEVVSENKVKEGVFFKSLVSACKLLDLLLVLNIQDFNPHEWLFVCDSIDAIFKETDNHPTSGIVDRIAASNVLNAHSFNYEPEQINKKSRKPFFASHGPITSISQLKPFFDHISIYNYECMYSLAPPDLDACEREITLDIFDFKE